MRKCKARFDKIIRLLQKALKERLSKNYEDRYILLHGRALELVESEERWPLIKELYSLTKEYKQAYHAQVDYPKASNATLYEACGDENGTVLSPEANELSSVSQTDQSSRRETASEKFYNALRGKDIARDDSRNARVKIFAALIYLGVSVDSPEWNNFVRMIMGDQTSQSNRFCDGLLPFKNSDDVKNILGGDEKFNGAFASIQHIFCPPLLNSGSQKIPHYSSEVRLPLLEQEEIKPDPTTPSRLFKIKFAPENFSAERFDGWLIRKIVPASMSRELEIWAQLRNNKRISGHIVDMIATIQHGEEVSLIMAIAEGNLDELMNDKLHWTKGVGTDDRRKLVRKFLEVVHAVALMHGELRDRVTNEPLCAVHFDLKPENILVFKDTDGSFTLRICDLGIADIRVGEQTQAVFDNPWHGACSSCSAPESLRSLHQQPKATCRMDVWNLGCIFKMYLAWVWGGRDGYVAFRAALHQLEYLFPERGCNDRFFTFHRRESPKSRINYHKVLRKDKSSIKVTVKFKEAARQYFTNLANGNDEDRDHMLLNELVEVIIEIALVPEPSARGSAAVLHERLERIISSGGKPLGRAVNWRRGLPYK